MLNQTHAEPVTGLTYRVRPDVAGAGETPDDVYGIHCAHHEYQGGHSLNGAMIADFLKWLHAQLN